jgi:recombination protein RecA
VFGPESAGKTSLALQIIGCAQRLGGLAAFVDAEHAFDPNWADLLGVNVDELFVSQPDCGEQALEIVDGLVRSRAVDIIVVDSVAALVPRAELEGDMGDAQMGLQARLMSQAMRKLTGICSKNGVTVIFINQIREKIGVMYGSPETTTGGRALKFYASVRLDVRKRDYIKVSDVPIGNIIKVKAVKNKAGCPFRETLVNLMYKTGFDVVNDTAQYAVDNVLEKTGNTYSFQGEKIAVGAPATVAALREEADLFEQVRAAVEKKIQESS